MAGAAWLPPAPRYSARSLPPAVHPVVPAGAESLAQMSLLAHPGLWWERMGERSPVLAQVGQSLRVRLGSRAPQDRAGTSPLPSPQPGATVRSEWLC